MSGASCRGVQRASELVIGGMRITVASHFISKPTETSRIRRARQSESESRVLHQVRASCSKWAILTRRLNIERISSSLDVRMSLRFAAIALHPTIEQTRLGNSRNSKRQEKRRSARRAINGRAATRLVAHSWDTLAFAWIAAFRPGGLEVLTNVSCRKFLRPWVVRRQVTT